MRSDARKRDDKPLVTITAVEWAEALSDAWLKGHAAGRDYQGDGWNSDFHDPNEDNPYRAS